MPDSIIYAWGVWLFMGLGSYLAYAIKPDSADQVSLDVKKSCFQLLFLTVLGAVVGHFIG